MVEAGVDELAAVLEENRSACETPSVLYQSVLPSAACQLGCDYCGQTHRAKTMSSDEQAKLVRRLRSQLEVAQYQELQIGWFGGEPLLGMHVIRQLTQALRATAHEFGAVYSATMVTNGLALTPETAREAGL